MAMLPRMEDSLIVAQGGLSRLKELLRGLERAGVQSSVLPPADGCRTG